MPEVMQKKIHVAIITNIITTYREGFYDRLFKCDDLDVKVYCQDYMPGMNLTSIHKKYGDRIRIIKYISAKQEKIVWQFLPWREILTAYDVVFVGGNPRVLSDVLISTIMHFIGKNVVHWTMAHSFRANCVTENIRLMWSKIFKNILVYTDRETEFLRKKGFKKNYVLGMNNGLDQKKIDAEMESWTMKRLTEWRMNNGLGNRTLILSCARLDRKNRFELVVQALPEMISHVPDLLWCLIGDGAERSYLTKMVENAGLSNHVRVVGSLYQEDKLAPWFLSSELFVHPAAIGLACLHAFGYGLPIVTHDLAESHGPEYAAFKPALTGRNFCIDNPQSLAETIIDLLRDKNALTSMKARVLRIAREEYNVDVMVDRFVAMSYKALNKTLPTET
ncbi:glycosyltransferase [bacterium]|nr:glycosyltransferase [bacterium]